MKQQYTYLPHNTEPPSVADEVRRDERLAEESSWYSEGNGAAMNVEWDD
jgi:hypothetical protein